MLNRMTLTRGADATSTPLGQTRADFYTGGRYLICADVDTGGRRLFDCLRDASRKYLDIRRVVVLPMDGIEAEVAYPDGLLSKDDIEWVAIRAEPPRAEARLYAFVRKAPIRVALLLDSCRIEGTVHIDNNATDPVLFFLRGLEKSSDRFVAVTNATITPSPETSDEPARLVIVNRVAIRLYSAQRAESAA